MRKLISQLPRLGSALATLAAAALCLPAIQAQLLHKRSDCSNCYPAPTTITPMTPGTPVTPGTPATPPDMTTPLTEPTFASEQAFAGGFEGFAADSGVGYIDRAIIQSQFRFRFDSAQGANRPDRAEFFYPKCGCFRINGVDPNAEGPPPGAFNSGLIAPEFDLDYQEYSSYLELALGKNFSVFFEAPIRSVNFSDFTTLDGWGDLNAGFKYALINDCDRVLTFQLRNYFPTGQGDHGLGTEHYSVEPALLLYQRLSERWIMEGEFRYWIPIDGSDFAGEVLRYGIGLTYVLADSGNFRILPVAEVVTWTVLNGAAIGPGGIEDATGDTIVNGKFGVRFGFGKASEPGLISGSEIYVGYGRAFTGDIWYEDILRVEYRMPF